MKGVDVGGWTEIQRAELLSRAVAPRSDHDVAHAPGFFRRSFLAHPHVAAESSLTEDVEPAAEGMGRDRDPVEELLDVERFPIVVVVWMRQPVVVELRVASYELLHRVQGQMLLD